MNEPNWALARKQQNLAERARILQTVRAFFAAGDFLEVETPHRIPVNAPEPHIDPVTSGDWSLHTSPELAMKRLLAAGYPQLFQLCRVWRDGERGRHHLPEFTLLEWSRAGVDYHVLMDDCTRLLTTLVPDGKLVRQGRAIDLAPPWEALTVREAFSRYASLDIDTALDTDRFDETLTAEIEPYLGRLRPTFLIEYPAQLAALARRKPGDTTVAERFELYIDGLELANAFSELTDSTEQRRRFETDEAARRAVGKPPRPLPEPFLAELGGLDTAAGIALGFDRLVMLLTDAVDIGQVVAFTPDEL